MDMTSCPGGGGGAGGHERASKSGLLDVAGDLSAFKVPTDSEPFGMFASSPGRVSWRFTVASWLGRTIKNGQIGSYVCRPRAGLKKSGCPAGMANGSIGA